MRLHFGEAYGEIGRSHLLFQNPLQAPRPAGTMKLETVLAVVIERTEEWDSLNVIPVEMGDEHVSRDRMTVELVPEGLSQHAEAGAAVENIQAVPDAHFHAGSIAPIAHIFGLRSRCRSANSPELNTHRPPCWLNSHLPPRRRIRQFIRWLQGSPAPALYNGRRHST